jgi:NAD(P)-dependent dehydrogenase (short-subunit alcohol dehydrogenase family)
VAGRLANEVVLVTGAARGIGRAVAVKAAVSEWDDVFDVDLKGAFLMSRQVLPPMTENKHGSIVNIASIHSQLTTAGMFPYAAANPASWA